MLYIIFFMICFMASVEGAICGIGGGVIIKPVLDLFGVMDVAAISFLSGCTVLSMTTYSVIKSKLNGEKQVETRTGLPLALGASVGGLLGKWMFSGIAAMSSDINKVGAVQSVCLLLITVGTLVYTIYKSRITTHKVNNAAVCVVIGVVLGIMSSFLGIGGGPINLVVLYFFFSMETKTAAANSLYIIFFSQLTSLISTLAGGNVPEFGWMNLISMAAGGILGGAAGRAINKKIDNAAVEKLFIGLMVVIILISAYNSWNYSTM